MNRPEMILFDYGNTLCYEPEFSTLRAVNAIMGHITKNPDDLTAEEIDDFSQKMFRRFYEYRKQGCEVHEYHAMRFIYEYLGIEFDLPIEDMEDIFCCATSEGAIMPDADRVIKYLADNGIRSGVVSNIGWSGRSLSKRINKLLSDNKFEFILASSEYVLRKPDPMLFELALRKAHITADKVWFCGDNISADIVGAHSAGIFPVHYDNREITNLWIGSGNDITPDFEYLHINDWSELIDSLEKMR